MLSVLLKEKLMIRQALMYVREKDRWVLRFYLGVDKEKFDNVDVEALLSWYNDITMIKDSHTFFGQFDFVIPVLYRGKVFAYMLVGDLEETSLGMSPTVKNLRFVQTIANIIIMSMEKKRLILEAFERERLKKELETASKIQRMLILDVSKFPTSDDCKIYAYYLPHYELGGDLYDIGRISDKEIYFAIADVSGKGLSAALLMSNFQANLKAQFSVKNLSLERIIRNLNKIVIENSHGDRFITMFIGKYNRVKRRLVYVNAGHQPAMLYDKVEKRTYLLDKGCPGIGMVDEISNIEVGKIRITNPSKLLLYTDGISELSYNGEPDYGFRRLKVLLENDLDIEQTIKLIIKDLNLTKDNQKLFDDVTLLGFDFL